MIIVYVQIRPDALKKRSSPRALNIRYAVGAIAHAPWVWSLRGDVPVEIAGSFDADQLPKYGPNLLARLRGLAR